MEWQLTEVPILPSRLRRFVALLALGAVVAAIVATPAGSVYYTPLGGQCVSSYQAFVSGSNSWGVNVVRVPYFCLGYSGPNSWPGLYYIRPNGTTYPPVTFFFQGAPYPPGYVDYVDPRDISYGRAVCKNYGPTPTWFQYCWAGA